MKALVTGATGFLGSRLLRHLVDGGHHVAALVRATSSCAQIADLTDRVSIHVVDEQPATLHNVLMREQPDVVFHIATFYRRDHQPEDLAPLLESNVAFPLRLIDAMARAGVKRFVNTGSAWQFTGAQTYRPVCLHSASKRAFEALLEYFVDTGAIDAITLVMHDTYGPGDPRRKVFGLLSAHAGASEPLKVSGGDQIINLVHVRDAVAAFDVAARRLLEARSACSHETYSISGGEPRSLREIVEIYLRSTTDPVPIQWGARPYHEREVMVAWQGGAALPGWQPQVDLANGLREIALDASLRMPGLASTPVASA